MNEQQMWAACVNLLMNVDAVAFRYMYIYVHYRSQKSIKRNTTQISCKIMNNERKTRQTELE